MQESALERAAKRWGMTGAAEQTPQPEVQAAPQSEGPKRDFKGELTGWGDRPGVSEKPSRSDTYESPDNGRAE